MEISKESLANRNNTLYHIYYQVLLSGNVETLLCEQIKYIKLCCYL